MKTIKTLKNAQISKDGSKEINGETPYCPNCYTEITRGKGLPSMRKDDGYKQYNYCYVCGKEYQIKSYKNVKIQYRTRPIEEC